MIDLQSDAWISALRVGLGADLRATARSAGAEYLALFRAGPFRIAYPDFPFGMGPVDRERLRTLLAVAREIGADVVRLQCDSEPQSVGTLAAHRLQGVRIESLADWDESRIEKARRARNRSSRSRLTVRRGTSPDGEIAYRLYRATVLRHGGSLRYSRAYFEAIAPHAALVAEIDGVPCGFVCTGRIGSLGVYLHGGHDPAVRALYPSDALFLSMLREAKSEGLESFDFLPSPPAQRSLVDYKVAWGGRPVDIVVHDVAIRPLRARAFELAYTLSSMFRRAMRFRAGVRRE